MNLSVFIKDKFKGITSLGLDQNLQKLCTIYRFLTSIRGMIKWVTPLGRVFKIHEFFRHDFVGF